MAAAWMVRWRKTRSCRWMHDGWDEIRAATALEMVADRSVTTGVYWCALVTFVVVI